MSYITHKETPWGITKSYERYTYRAGQQLHTTVPFVFNLCSKCSAWKCPMSYFTVQQNKPLSSTREYCWAQFFIAWIFIFKLSQPRQMLLLWQHLITSLTLECLGLNDFRVRCSRKIRGQGFFSLFEFYYLGRKGNPLLHRRNYFWATAWRLFAWVHEETQLFMLTAVDIWLSPYSKVT